MHAIDRYSIKAWAQELLEQDYAHATVQRHISLLSASLTAAADAGVIPANPALRLKLGLTPNSSERTLTREEQVRLFAAFAPADDATESERAQAEQDQAIVATLLGAGGRWSESIALGPQHFTSEGVRFRRSWDALNHKLKPYTKGKLARTAPLAPWLLEIITPVLEACDSDYVFQSIGGTQPVDYGNWRTRRWAPALERSGINDGYHDDPVTIHTLRHTYATEQLDAGLSLRDVGNLLGHSNLATTEKYINRSGRVNQAAAQSIPDPRKAPAPEPTGPEELPDNVTRVNFGAA